MTELSCVLDYETRSRVNLEKAGAITYAQHPSTSIFCLAYKINDGKTRLWVPEKTPMPDDLWQAFQYGILVAHNASFERAITRHCLPRYRLITARQKEVLRQSAHPSRWRCTAAKAAASSLPRKLEGAAHVLKLPIQKDAAGHKLMLKYSKPRKPSKNNPKIWWDDPKDLQDIYHYCKTDVDVEYLLDEALPDLSDYEQKIWELDQKINDRGVLIDVPLVKTILGLIKEEMGNITRGVCELSNGTIEKPTQTAKVLAWLNKRGAGMANLQANTIKEKLLEKDLTDDMRQMLEYRQGGSKTSTAKYQAMLDGVGPDNRARELLLYNGAVPTARWSGKRVQPQNLIKSHLKLEDVNRVIKSIKAGRSVEWVRKNYGPPMKVFASLTRGMIISSPGCELFCADFSAVEARLAFWVAEHIEGIRAFKEDRKLYEEMASETFGIPLEEITKDSLERWIGKTLILGAQYGVGWAKFLKLCHQQGHKEVTAEVAKKAVFTYRKIHHPIPALWKNIEQAAIRAILNPGSHFSLNKVTIYVKGKWLNIKLPSGRRLRYFKPHVTQKQLSSGRMVPEIRYWSMELHQWKKCAIWGGIFVNHIIQGIARDLMANAMLNIEEGQYDFLLSVHDEGLSERKIGEGNLDEYIRLIVKLPLWAKGAPITASGFVADRYHK